MLRFDRKQQNSIRQLSFILKKLILKKESACNAGDLGSIPGLGRSSGEGKHYPLQHSRLENSTGCIVHSVTNSDMTEQLLLLLKGCWTPYQPV